MRHYLAFLAIAEHGASTLMQAAEGLDIALPAIKMRLVYFGTATIPCRSSQSVVLSLEQVLGSSNSHASSNAEERPRVHDLGEAWPEAVLLYAVFLKVEVLVRIILRVTLLLVFLVLPAVC